MVTPRYHSLHISNEMALVVCNSELIDFSLQIILGMHCWQLYFPTRLPILLAISSSFSILYSKLFCFPFDFSNVGPLIILFAFLTPHHLIWNRSSHPKIWFTEYVPHIPVRQISQAWWTSICIMNLHKNLARGGGDTVHLSQRLIPA